MVDFIKKFIKTELFLYLFIGFLTTVVNIVVFTILCKTLNANAESGLSWKMAEAIAFIVAVLFAFVTNKLIVFKSTSLDFSVIGKEFGGFIIGRLITEAINFVMMWYMIDQKHINELFTKIVASVVVIVLNYIFSKFIIFKKHVE